MQRSLWIAVAAIVAAGGYFIGSAWIGGDQARPVRTIAITQIATHPALDEVRVGILARLAEAGYTEKNTRIIFRNANGDASLTSAIAQEFARLNPSVVIPISTPSALAIAREVKSAPIVFSGVTDPVKVGLVSSLNQPGKNITGVSDRWPFKEQVRTFLRYFPSVNRIGMIYTRGDDVSEIGVRAIRKLSTEMGFKLELRPVSSATDIYPSTSALFRDVDAIYTGIDHLVLENMEGLVRASSEAKKPLFGGESGSVQKGAVLAVSINMTEFGRLTGDIVLRVLKGSPPGSIPVATVTGGQLLVNRAAATRFGLDLQALERAGAKFVGAP
jgi:putative ABC transport system substrate-binding protein